MIIHIQAKCNTIPLISSIIQHIYVNCYDFTHACCLLTSQFYEAVRCIGGGGLKFPLPQLLMKYSQSHDSFAKYSHSSAVKMSHLPEDPLP